MRAARYWQRQENFPSSWVNLACFSAQPNTQAELQPHQRALTRLPALLTEGSGAPCLSAVSCFLAIPIPQPHLEIYCVWKMTGNRNSYCKGAMIKFVPAMNVSVIGRREGREGQRRDVIERSTINGGKVTWHQSSVIVINITLASASPSQSTLPHLDRLYSCINTWNKQREEKFRDTLNYIRIEGRQKQVPLGRLCLLEPNKLLL